LKKKEWLNFAPNWQLKKKSYCSGQEEERTSAEKKTAVFYEKGKTENTRKDQKGVFRERNKGPGRGAPSAVTQKEKGVLEGKRTPNARIDGRKKTKNEKEGRGRGPGV